MRFTVPANSRQNWTDASGGLGIEKVSYDGDVSVRQLSTWSVRGLPNLPRFAGLVGLGFRSRDEGGRRGVTGGVRWVGWVGCAEMLITAGQGGGW